MPVITNPVLPLIDGNAATKFAARFREAGPDECWVWSGTINDAGYGILVIDTKRVRAHRIAFALDRGAEPENLVLHICDNRRCVNPRHLMAGDHKENARQMVERGRKGRGPIGAEVNTATLTRESVRQVRYVYGAGRKNQPELAEIFGVTQSTISAAVGRRTWRHVA